MDDDLMPNDGEAFTNSVSYPDIPEERVEEEAAEAAVIAASYPILPKLADWFEKQMEQAGSLQNIETKSLTISGVKYTRTVSVEAQVLAYQLLHEMLAQVYHDFQEWQEDK